jgi:NTE family protein
MFDPRQLPRLSSSTFDRIDLAAEIYDAQVFEGRTFSDMRRRAPRPFVLVNAANMTTGSVFPFTQDSFDFLGSDLDAYRVARAVAASSAVPGIFSPLTLENRPAARGFSLPAWVEEGLRSDDRRHRRAAAALAPYHTDKATRRYVHLLDGGITDNSGLRVILEQLQWGFLGDLLDGRPAPDGRRPDPVQTLLVISVNARGATAVHLDADKESPGVTDSLVSTLLSGVENATVETIQQLADIMAERCRLADAGRAPPLSMHFVEVALDEIADPAERKRLMAVPTSLAIEREEAVGLVRAGRSLLRDDPAFRRFLEEWEGGADEGATAFAQRTAVPRAVIAPALVGTAPAQVGASRLPAPRVLPAGAARAR